MTSLAPIDQNITIEALIHDPYAIYARLRREAPVLRVAAIGRTMLTKAADTRMVKGDPVRFSSNDPNTPMERAFQAHTLMRKDGDAHLAERNAMASAYGARAIREHWEATYGEIAEAYVARLPRGEIVDLLPALAAPYAARGLAHVLGLTNTTDEQMIRWSQALINGAGNFAWADAPFEASDAANVEMNAAMDALVDHHRTERGPSAFAVMLNAEAPLPMSQIRSNLKIAIGGGINEPRDALCTILFGLLSDPDQWNAAKGGMWAEAFEEGIRWCAPIQASSRLVTEDVEIGNCLIPARDTVMTIQASACHDEALYEDPHLFNIHRAKTQHQAFGNGAHFCQGAHIARRMLAQIMLPLLADRFPNMELAGKAPFRGFGFRGPITLPVHLK